MKLARTSLKAVWKLKHLLQRPRPHLFLACMPKSASTFIANALCAITGFERFNVAYGGLRSEQDLYLPRLIDCHARATVHQHHIRATETNLKLMRRFGIRPVVLVRRLFDAVVSVRDHYHREGHRGPKVYATDDFEKLDSSAQIDFIIDLIMPWYVSFYVSWDDVIRAGQIEAMWLTYEEFIADKEAALSAILAFNGVPVADGSVGLALQRVDPSVNRFNKGVAGRGETELTEAQRDRIRALTRYYPSCNFGRIGL